MGDVKIVDGSILKLKDGSTITLKNDSVLSIQKVQNIAPIAAHIKEVNHIDPITIESFHVNEIKNIDPIRVEKFNVTNLPMVNMSVRQLPAVDLNVKRLPAISVGSHQDFCLPSNYILRARILGIEFFRINLDGQTSLLPKERYRREQARRSEKSFPEPVTAGNPAIPSKSREESSHITYIHQENHSCKTNHIHKHSGRDHYVDKQVMNGKLKRPVYNGLPGMNFNIPNSSITEAAASSVSSGE